VDDPNLIATASWYSRFAEIEAPGQSAIFEEWARGVADDASLLALLAELPRPKRQPNLLFACARLLGCPLVPYPEWREWVLAHWSFVAAEMLVRATQTNEPRRCAVLLPVLAQIEGPIALLEVGASAGLCLYPDRYSYRYYNGAASDGRRVDPADGPSTVLLECETTGNPPTPPRMPDIVWRAGIDLNPLDLRNDDDVLWLETLIWPEQTERRERIRAAIDIVRADPPRIVRGDAVDTLLSVAAEAPADAHLVVISSAAIVYLMPEQRSRFIELVQSLDATWISNEGAGIVPQAAAAAEGRMPPVIGELLLARDGIPLAFTGPHGQRLDWFT
jgi:hypothetical protein